MNAEINHVPTRIDLEYGRYIEHPRAPPLEKNTPVFREETRNRSAIRLTQRAGAQPSIPETCVPVIRFEDPTIFPDRPVQQAFLDVLDRGENADDLAAAEDLALDRSRESSPVDPANHFQRWMDRGC